MPRVGDVAASKFEIARILIARGLSVVLPIGACRSICSEKIFGQ